MKAEWKIPFKKLEWHSGITEEGQNKGLVYQIGRFYINGTYIRTYYVTNFLGLPIEEGKIDHFLVYNIDLEDKFKSNTLEEAKEECQKDFEKFIIETFFDLKQITDNQ